MTIIITGKCVFCKEDDSTFRRKPEEPDGECIKMYVNLHEREVNFHITLEYGPAVKSSCGIIVHHSLWLHITGGVKTRAANTFMGTVSGFGICFDVWIGK